MNEIAPLRLALDQNFPTPLINRIQPYLPGDIELASLHQLDRRLSELGDRELFIALHQLGWDGLITNNYKMLDVPAEMAAVIKTKMVLIAIVGLGHDPLRAVGALMLELPSIRGRLHASRSNVFRIKYTSKKADDGWTFFSAAAERLGRAPQDLWGEVAVSAAEISTPVLPASDSEV